jgi:hypothetical protein
MGLTTFRTFVSGLRVAIDEDGFAVFRFGDILNLEVTLIVVRTDPATGCA